MNNTTQHILKAAVIRLLRPLVRILLRNGFSYGAFADLAKWVFVDVASREFALPGRKQSVSRVSVITGLNRKEVSRVQAMSPPQDSDVGDNYNRAARVISGWLTDPDFSDAQGQTRALALGGEGGSFSDLVARHSGDMPPRAVLDELLRVGAVAQDEHGAIRLMQRAYVPRSTEADKLHILGTDVSQLIQTIDHNLQCEHGQAHFQRKVSYDNLPEEALPALRAMTGEQAQALLEQLNQWMAQHDRDSNPAVSGRGRKQAAIGIYYYEHDVSEEDGS